jgi:hypothetical protein
MSEERKYLKPVPGCLVKDPASQKPLDEGGEWKPWNTHWARKLRHNEVVEAEPLQETAEPKTEDADEIGGRKQRKRARE